MADYAGGISAASRVSTSHYVIGMSGNTPAPINMSESKSYILHQHSNIIMYVALQMSLIIDFNPIWKAAFMWHKANREMVGRAAQQARQAGRQTGVMWKTWAEWL